MAKSTQGDRLRARVTVTVEVPAAEASVDKIQSAVIRSLIADRAAGETRIVSVDAVELVDPGGDTPPPKQPVNRYGRTFWESAPLELLIAEQGVTPIRDIDELVGDFVEVIGEARADATRDEASDVQSEAGGFVGANAAAPPGDIRAASNGQLAADCEPAVGDAQFLIYDFRFTI